MAQAKTGDFVEALTTQDIRQGHDVLLKKGATLLGHVDSVQLATATDPASTIKNVFIVFDRAKPKKADEMSLHLVIQALAPKSDVESDSVPFATGRGMPGATVDAAVAGHVNASRGTVNPSTTKSVGVQDIAGLELRERITDNKLFTVIAVSRSDVQLKKDTQLVMRVVNQ